MSAVSPLGSLTGLNPLGSLANVATNTVNSAVGQVQGMLSVIPNTIQSILPPIPIPPIPILPIPSQFEVTPFLEHVFVDPFETLELAVLSETQLAIDKVGNVLDSLLPPELTDELLALPELAAHLLKTGMDLVSTVMDLVSKLPSLLNLSNLLRMVPIMSVINSIDSLISTAINLGMSIVNFAENAIISVFSFINDIENGINSLLYSAEFFVANTVNNIGYAISSVANNVIMIAALVSGIANTVINFPTYMANTLENIGVGFVSSVSAFTSVMASSTFGAVYNTLNAISYTKCVALGFAAATVNTVSNVGTYVHDLFSFPYGNVLSSTVAIYSQYNNPLLYSNCLGLKATYGNATLGSYVGFLNNFSVAQTNVILRLYSTYPTFCLNPILVAFNNYTQPQLAQFYNEILDSLPISAMFSNLLPFYNTYGKDLVDVAITAVQKTLPTNLEIWNSEKRNDATDLLTINTTIGSSNFSYLVSQDTAQLNSTITFINNYGADTISKTMMPLLNVITPTNIDSIVSVLTNTPFLPAKTLSNAYASINTMTSSQVTSIVNKMVLSEVSTIINHYGVSGSILRTLIKRLTGEAALAGNLKVLMNLVANFPNTLTSDYLRYLVTTLLSKYSLTPDDNAMGLQAASMSFYMMLNTILPNWNTTLRNGIYIYNQLPLITASKDALLLLTYINPVSIEAIIQKDNMYNLPNYLAA